MNKILDYSKSVMKILITIKEQIQHDQFGK
jgi:hypothetical protein